MKIIYDEEYFEEPDEEIGAMVIPPLVGVVTAAKTETAHLILLQLEKDIQRQAEVNVTKAPIDKNLINHFKTIQTKAIEIQREKEKEERK
ncbi:hypothetical protein ABIB38_001771 [Massilia sp. UYP11]|uniref:hypothetical protein n=1 Tax=Massilia sp. UYP11 TaxID=1756385 RepID=UPI003D1FCB9E